MTRDDAIKAANSFCENLKLEKCVRDFIADLTTKLNRSNLSAAQGARLAKKLAQAYETLEQLESAEIPVEPTTTSSETGHSGA
jgi:hypothetical protein